MNIMKSLLIVYSEMVIGGSTTSLLSLLNLIDYDQYEVDLLLYSNCGELQDKIDKRVVILPEMSASRKLWKKYVRPGYAASYLVARALSKKKGNRLINSQFLSKYEAISCMKLSKHYDIAISFLEFLPMEFVARCVNADRKISWIHIDIKEAGLLPKVGRSTYKKVDQIVLVSNSCVKNFTKLYPEFAEKCQYLPNLLSADIVRHMSEDIPHAEFSLAELNLVTVARIALVSKGLDRAVNVFEKLKLEGHLPTDVRWFIIGDGPDYSSLKEMIETKGLSDQIILLGKQANPFPIEKCMDVFLLPSRYEGKPMAVTEAQMLGVVPYVLEYSSAKEQIISGFDGVVSANNEEALYHTLHKLFMNRDVLTQMEANILARDYSNKECIQLYYELFNRN